MVGNPTWIAAQLSESHLLFLLLELAGRNTDLSFGGHG